MSQSSTLAITPQRLSPDGIQGQFLSRVQNEFIVFLLHDWLPKQNLSHSVPVFIYTWRGEMGINMKWNTTSLIQIDFISHNDK